MPLSLSTKITTKQTCEDPSVHVSEKDTELLINIP